MKIAIVGSREINNIDLNNFFEVEDIQEVVSGGARGVDTLARNFALRHHFKLTEFLPDYRRYGRVAPLLRNKEIVRYADKIYVFWDGKCRGSKFVINEAQKQGKPLEVVLVQC